MDPVATKLIQISLIIFVSCVSVWAFSRLSLQNLHFNVDNDNGKTFIRIQLFKKLMFNKRDLESSSWTLHPLPHVSSASNGECYSLKEASLFYPPTSNLPPPSPALIQALRKQEELQKRCTNGIRNWESHFYKPEPGYQDCKYLVWLEDTNGIGNRLLSLVTAFLYALLTNRVLLVDNSKYMDQLLCNPFPETSWWTPKGFPIFELSEADHQTKFVNSKMQGKKSKSRVATVILENWFIYTEQQDHFFCDYEQELLQKHAVWLGFVSDFYAVPGLYLLSSFRELLHEWFPHNLVIPYIARYLLHPGNDAWHKIKHMHGKYFSSADVKIGVQVRTMNSFDPNVSERIFDCLGISKALPAQLFEPERTSIPNVIPDSGQEFTEKKKGKWTRYSLFVTSLDIGYAEFLRREFDRKATMHENDISVHFASHEVKEVHNVEKDQAAIAEIWVLSMSDILFHSWHSTFGYVARALGAQDGSYLMNICDVPEWDPRDMWKTNNKPACEASILPPEACFHVAPDNLTCPGSPKLDFTDPRTTHPDIQICHDVNKGISIITK